MPAPKTYLMGAQKTFNPVTAMGAMALRFEFDDIDTLYTDTGLTTKVGVVGQTVKGVADKSGNARNFTEATNAPTFSAWGLEFNGSQYLSSAAAATLNLFYRGGPFTLIIDFNSTNKSTQTQFFFDSTNFNSALNGISLWFDPVQRYNYLWLTNSLTHTTTEDKTTTTEADPEYLQMQPTNFLKSGAAAYAFNSNTGYSRVNNGTLSSQATTGSPAASDSPYAVRLGATAFSGTFGFYGSIRRIWLWNTFLGLANVQTLINKIQYTPLRYLR